MPVQGTLAELYLREHRGITGKLPDSLRYHTGIYLHDLKKRIPALIIIAKNAAGKTQAIQTLFLDRETANKANIESNKRITGPIKGALVTLQEGNYRNSPTLIAEGVETALSLKMAAKDAHIKATLGVSNYLNIPPAQVSQKVIFCLDNDGAGSMSEKTAIKGMQRLVEAGKTVFYNQPDILKTDYNDSVKAGNLNDIKAKINDSVRYQSTKGSPQTYEQHIQTA